MEWCKAGPWAQEDLDEMNRITLGRSAIEEATTAREAGPYTQLINSTYQFNFSV